MNFTRFPYNLVLWVHPKSEGISLDLGKNLCWELVPYVVVTLVSKFHSIWCPIAQESRLKRKGWILWENRVSRYLIPDKVRNSHTLSGPTPDIVRPRVFNPMFVNSFRHILLTGCPIDPILFLLRLELRGDHFYVVGWCVNHLLAVFWLWGLNLRHKPVVTKEFD
jgi:hypothetical protein